MPAKPSTLLLWLTPLFPLTLALIIYQAGWQTGSFLFINQITHTLPDRLWAGLTFLGNGWGIFALAFPLLVLAPRLLSAGIFAGILSGALGQILKAVFDLPRPAGILADGSFYRIGTPLLNHSMPSGHTLTAFAIASALYFSCDKSKRPTTSSLFGIATLVGLSRIAVGAHWLTDVLAGAGIGLWCGLIGANLASRIPDASLLPSKLWLRTIALGGLVTAYTLLTQTMDIELNLPLQYADVFLIAITLGLFFKSQGAKVH